MTANDMRVAAIRALGQNRVDQLARPQIPVVSDVPIATPEHRHVVFGTVTGATSPQQEQDEEAQQGQNSEASQDISPQETTSLPIASADSPENCLCETGASVSDEGLVQDKC